MMSIERKLHEKAVLIAKNYHRAQVELLDILEQLDRHKAFYKLGYSSLFDYATKALGLSQDVAYIYIRVARKFKQVPKLKEEIKKGTITVSKAKRISSVLTESNQSEWLEKAKILSSRKIEKEIALVSPKTAIKEKMEYVNIESEIKEKVSYKSQIARVQLQAGVSEELMFKIRRAQDILSQKLKKPVSLEETLEAMTKLFIEKNDPVEKAKRQKVRGKLNQVDSASEKTNDKAQKKLVTGPVSIKKDSKRNPIPAHIRHQVYLQFQGQCANIGTNDQRCSSRRHLEIHHLIPVSQGGTNDPKNLTLLCHGHHKSEHRRC